MAKHVIWCGPVSAAQRAGATVAGAAEHFVSCTGAECRAKGEALGERDGRHLPALLRQLGIDIDEPDLELYVGAFSAGGSLVKVLLRHADDRALVRGVLLADATYELAGVDSRPAASPSLVEYAAEAFERGDRFFLATASANANNYQGQAQPSGADTLERIVYDLETRLGRPPVTSNYVEHVDDLQVRHVWSFARNVQLVDLGSAYRHEEHATKIAPRLWPALLQPWIEDPGRPGLSTEQHAEDEDGSGLGGILFGCLAVVAAAILGAAAMRRRPDF